MRDHTVDTITVTATDSSDYTFDINNITVDTVDINNITSDTVDIINITTSPIKPIGNTITLEDSNWADNITWDIVEFEDGMPSVAKVEDMCKDYPALEQAYEKFKTIYAMVHQDWKGKQEDDEAPF